MIILSFVAYLVLLGAVVLLLERQSRRHRACGRPPTRLDRRLERDLRLLLTCRAYAFSPLALSARIGGRPHHARSALGLQHLLRAGLKR